MQLRAEEISQIIKQQIASYDKQIDVVERGSSSSSQGISWAWC